MQLRAPAPGQGSADRPRLLPSQDEDLREGSLWVRVSGHKADPTQRCWALLAPTERFSPA